MTKNFRNVEEVLADEAFLAWYFRESAAEVNAWENWLAANTGYSSVVQEAVDFIKGLPQEAIPVSKSSVKEKLALLNQRIDQLENASAPVIAMKNQGSRRWLAIAAAVVLLAGGFAFWQLTGFNAKANVRSSYGETRNNKLLDGSLMILNANSNATFSKGWEEGKDREVWLEGEAFFDVQKTYNRSRFIVHSGNLDVIVTGTQFNVSNRGNKVSVYLAEGSVLLQAKDGKQIVMQPGDYVEMKGDLAEKKNVKEEKVLAWKDNRLSFDSTSMKDVAQIIHDHYGVNVKLGDEQVGAKSLTGIMSNNNLDDLLEAIRIAIDVKISRSDSSILISDK